MKKILAKIFPLSKKNLGIIISLALIVILISIVCLVPKKGVNKEKCDQSIQIILDSIQFDEEVTPLFIKLVEERNGYEILSIKKEENIYVGTLRVFAPDVYTVVKKVENTEEEYTIEQLQKKIEDEIVKADIIEVQVHLNFQNEDGNIIPILTSDFLDAYYGGVYRLREEIIKGG